MEKDEVESLLARYTVRTTPVERGPNLWSYLEVEILFDGEKIGSYQLNYSSLFETFVPFVQDGAVYSLYSSHYTATRVMRLPSCEDIGGEEPSSGGFCPTGFYVPYDPANGLTGHWGFLSGCVWGDDSSWKIRYLDLSRVAEGIVKHDDRFGYLEMASRLSLRESVNLEFYDAEYGEIEFTTSRSYITAKEHFVRDERAEWISDDDE